MLVRKTRTRDFNGNEAGKTTFQKAKLNFETYLYKEGKAKGTITAYHSDLETFIDFLRYELGWKIRYIDQFTWTENEQYKNYLQAKVNDGELKKTTAVRKYNAMKTYFAYLSEEYGIENIVYGDKWGNKKNAITWENEGEDLLPDILTLEELNKIIGCINDSNHKQKFRDIAIFETLISTGCRRSEILQMKWRDIDFSRGTAKIYRQKTKNANAVPITKEMIDALSTYRNTLPCYGDYVFQSRENHKMSKSAFSNTIKKWVVASGVMKDRGREISAHTFRHTFITECIRNGIQDSIIIKYTGHKTPDGLMPYKHLVATDCIAVAEAISAMRSNTSLQ